MPSYGGDTKAERPNSYQTASAETAWMLVSSVQLFDT